MMHRAQPSAAAYDQIANDYDRTWSAHVREPQQRLSRELELEPGLRCADLGCGTGIDTLEMLEAVAPGEVVAVDLSSVMLSTVTERAALCGRALTTRCMDFAEFIASEPSASYDVVTLRFSLGYLDWRSLLPTLPRLLAPGGKLGLLTILSTSAQQAYTVYEQMVAELGLPNIQRSAPRTVGEIADGLRAGRALVESSWVSSFRLEFAGGEQLAGFLRESGIASHPRIDQLPPQVAQLMWGRFAQLAEGQRVGGRIPLDFQLGGVIARIP
jgi:ubiquinone/menaquinone biosynthesis C-methylase UbiE